MVLGCFKTIRLRGGFLKGRSSFLQHKWHGLESGDESQQSKERDDGDDAGANRVIHLDFDGHADNTAGYWKDGASAPAFDTNGDPAIFTTSERDRIIYIWQRIAEDYAMFDIDVTTEDPGVPALSKSRSSDLAYGIRVYTGGSSGGAGDWYTSSAGGVAFVGTFDVASDVPCWVFPGDLGNSEKNIAEAASHEVGHTLGLNHDGVTGGVSYYSGAT